MRRLSVAVTLVALYAAALLLFRNRAPGEARCAGAAKRVVRASTSIQKVEASANEGVTVLAGAPGASQVRTGTARWRDQRGTARQAMFVCTLESTRVVRGLRLIPSP